MRAAGAQRALSAAPAVLKRRVRPSSSSSRPHHTVRHAVRAGPLKGGPGGGRKAGEQVTGAIVARSAAPALNLLRPPSDDEVMRLLDSEYKRLLRAGDLMECVALLESLQQAGVQDVTGRVHQKRFFQACADRGAIPEAFRFVRLVQPPNIKVYSMLLSTCAAARDADAAFRAFREMVNARLRPDCMAFTSLIAACAKAGEVERAFEVYRDMNRVMVRPNTVTFGALVDCLSRDILRAAAAGDRRRVASRLAQCDSLQAEMKAAGVVPDAVMFNTLVSACGRAAALDKTALRAAFAAWREMRSLGLKTCAYTYSSLIDGCTRAGDPARALTLWEEHVAADATLQRTPELVGAAAHACAAIGDLARAMVIYRDSLTRGLSPDGVLFAILMDVAAKAGDVDFAFGLQEEMQRVGVAPNAAVCATLVGICAKEGAPLRAKSVFRAMRAADVRPSASAVNALVAAHARAGDLEGAFAALSELPAAGLAPDATTYATLISACARAGDVDRASKVFQRMRDVRVEPPAEAFYALITSCGQAGQIEAALGWHLQMREAGLQMDAATARTFLIAAARAGDLSAAWSVWRAWADARLPVSEAALNTILGVCLRRVTSLEPAAAVESPDGAARAEKAEWERRAVSAYLESTTSGGVVPRTETLSTLLACLRQPQPRTVRSTVKAAAAHLSPATSSALAGAHYSSVAAAGGATALYPERAINLFEEAQAAGVVPRFRLGNAANTVTEVDLRPLPPAAAEVCVLTLLRALRRRNIASGDSLRVNSVRFRVHNVAELVRLSAGGAKGASLRRTQTGMRTADLLRRLRIKYTGQLSDGYLDVCATEITRWLAQSVQANRAPQPLPGSAPRLPTQLREQMRRIRMKSF